MKKFLLAFIVLLAALFLMTFRPVAKGDWKNSLSVERQIISIAEKGGPADIVFDLQDDDNFYYVNRGAESGLDAEQLHQQHRGKLATIYYADHWSLIDWKNRSRHIYHVEIDGQMIYSEFEPEQ